MDVETVEVSPSVTSNGVAPSNEETKISNTVNQITIARMSTPISPILLPPFTGDNVHEDLIDWFEQYEYLSESLGWKAEERLAKLPLHLNGTARLRYTSIRPKLNTDRYNSYEKIKHGMLKVLLKPDYRSEYHKRITSQKQDRDQTPSSFVIKMERLCRRVDRNMTESTILSFIREGLDDRLKPWISAHDPKTIEELLEALQSAERSARESREMNDSDISRASSNAGAGETNSAILSMIGSLNKTVQSLSDRLDNLRSQPHEQGMNAPYQNQRQSIQCQRYRGPMQRKGYKVYLPALGDGMYPSGSTQIIGLNKCLFF